MGEPDNWSFEHKSLGTSNNKGTHTNTKEREKVIAFSQKTSYFFVAMVLRNPKRFLLNPSWKDKEISLTFP